MTRPSLLAGRISAMADILYGVNGEGSGHSARAREVLRHLQSRGHRVRVVTFDRGLQNLRSEFDVTEIHGLRFAYVENRVRYRKTIARNLLSAPRVARSFARLRRLAVSWKIQLVITDFEPLSCRLAHHLHLPVISIDNQHLLTNAAIELPRRYRRDALAAKMLTRLMTPRCDAYLVTSFFEAQPRDPRTFIFPPILRREVLKTQTRPGSCVLVYVTSPNERLARLLKSVRMPFLCYGFGRQGADANLTFKPPSQETFLRDLARCKAVLANSGFALLSEALYLRKPYLAVPVQHQFEQIFNAYHLQKMGSGAYWDELNKERIESFLFNLPSYQRELSGYPRSGNSALFNKLDEFIVHYTS